MPEDPTSGRDELSLRLRDLHRAAGSPPTRDIAEALQSRGLSWSQSKVSRTLSGRTAPSPEEVGALCDLLGADDSTRVELVTLVGEVRKSSRRLVLGRDAAAAQARIGKFQRASTLIRCVTLTTIPGELQTSDYVNAIFRTNQAGARQRLHNQSLLDEPGPRRWRLIIGEGALGWAILPPAQMASQVEHVAASLTRRNVEIGVLPWGRVLPRLPQHSWYLYDTRLVVTGGATFALDLSDSDDVAAYSALTDQHEQLAVYGREAREILVQAAERYRSLA